MAEIRIVDDWRRSPASGPSHYRSVMVIAEKWAEQRVLMRAYAESRDPLRPTIFLHGTELAIGPAGLDLQGPWGIHVGDEPEVRAPYIKDQLEASARQLSGGKGNAPRLSDEPRERDARAAEALRVPPARSDPQPPALQQVIPAGAAWIPPAAAAAYVPPIHGHHAAPVGNAAPPGHPDLWAAPLPRAAPSRVAPPAASARTALGYASGSGAQSAIVRLGLLPHISARLGRLVDRVVPDDFHIDARERRVLNALGEGPLTPAGVGQMLDLPDPVAFMDALTRKLACYHLDLVEYGAPHGREPTYRLRC